MYIEIPDAWIEAGKPTREEIFRYIKDNQESFNTDIELLKQTSVIDIINVAIQGSFNDYTTTQLLEFVPIFKAPVTGTITSLTMTLLEASSSGTLQLQIQKSTDNGLNWTNLLTSPVQVTGTAIASISGAVNWVSIASQEFNQNDLIRINFIGLQVNQGGFQLSVYGEVA